METLFYVRYEMNDYIRCTLIWPPKGLIYFSQNYDGPALWGRI